MRRAQHGFEKPFPGSQGGTPAPCGKGPVAASASGQGHAVGPRVPQTALPMGTPVPPVSERCGMEGGASVLSLPPGTDSITPGNGTD